MQDTCAGSQNSLQDRERASAALSRQAGKKLPSETARETKAERLQASKAMEARQLGKRHAEDRAEDLCGAAARVFASASAL
jgi:hypothetical protein